MTRRLLTLQAVLQQELCCLVSMCLPRLLVVCLRSAGVGAVDAYARSCLGTELPQKMDHDTKIWH